MQKQNPLARLMALMLLDAIMATPKKQAAEPEPSSAPANDPRNVSLDEVLQGFMAASQQATNPAQGTTADQFAFLEKMVEQNAPKPAPEAAAIPIVCVIPQDIADRCGMNEASFAPETLEGHTIALIASAMANLRELRARCDPAGAAKAQMADANLGAAVAALGLL